MQAAQCHTSASSIVCIFFKQRPEISKVILIELFVEEAEQSGAQMPQQLSYKLNSN